MATWIPDPTFYPSPRMAMRAPAEQLAYVASFDPQRRQPDGIAVVDVDPGSSSFAKIVGNVAMSAMPATNFIISAGTPVPHACVRRRRTPTSSGVI